MNLERDYHGAVWGTSDHDCQVCNCENSVIAEFEEEGYGIYEGEFTCSECLTPQLVTLQRERSGLTWL